MFCIIFKREVDTLYPSREVSCTLNLKMYAIIHNGYTYAFIITHKY